MRTEIFLVAAALLIARPVYARLSPAEAKMQATVEAEYDRSVALLERLVNQNSGTRNREGVEAVARMLRRELEELGFTVVWKPMSEVARAGHLLADHKGKPGTKRMLLIGHLDTVFEKDSPFQKFKRTLKSGTDRAEGPGVGDDKGGDVVIIAALRAMQAAGTLKEANIEVVLTGDEEDAGRPIAIARADLIAAGKRADVALDFEGLVVQDGNDMGSVARRSSNSWTVTATGKTGHSSGIFSSAVGDGAIFELTRILAAFRARLPEPNLTFNVGLIVGGATAALAPDGSHAEATGKANIIPPVATAKGDFRTLSPEQTERVRRAMTAIVAAHAPGTGASIVFEEGGYPPMAPTPGNKTLLDRLNGVNRDLGLAAMAPLDPLRRGAGDISFVAAEVDSLAGLGTDSTGDHAPGETVELTSIRRQASRVAILLTRLSQEKSAKPPR